MTTILVCGGRFYRNAERVRQVLDAARERLGLTDIVHGAATGADTLAAEWAKAAGVPARAFPAAWDDLTHPDAVIRKRSDGRQYDALAGARRNALMLTESMPGAVIAFRGGPGTHDMVKKAEAAGVKVHRIDWGEG